MTLTFELSQENQNKIEIYLDGEFWKEIDLFLYKKIIPRKVDSKESYHQAEKEIVKSLLYQKIVTKNFFSKEIEEWMINLGISNEIQNEILLEFQELGYINDQEFLKNFIEYSIHNKRGPQWIKNKLYLKKVPSFQINEALESYAGKEDQKEEILKILSSKFKEINLKDFKSIFKMKNFLLRKGYSIDLIDEVISLHNFS